MFCTNHLFNTDLLPFDRIHDAFDLDVHDKENAFKVMLTFQERAAIKTEGKFGFMSIRIGYAGVDRIYGFWKGGEERYFMKRKKS